jgi:hypothetical protein
VQSITDNRFELRLASMATGQQVFKHSALKGLLSSRYKLQQPIVPYKRTRAIHLRKEFDTTPSQVKLYA